MMPGPLLTVTISETVRRGRKDAMLLIVGHALVELIPVAAFVLGINVVLAQPAVIQTIGILGGGFLLWIAYSILSGVARKEVSLDLADHGDRLAYGAVTQGVVVSVSNPYFVLWWMTIGAKLIADALAAGVAGLIVFYVAHELSDFVWYGAVTSAVAGGKRFIGNRVYRAILGVCGVFLVLLAAGYILSSIGFFLRLVR